MRCKQCNYRLKGLRSRQCPECGLGFDPNDPSTFSSSLITLPKDSRIFAWCLGMGAIGCAIGVLGAMALASQGYETGDAASLITILGVVVGALVGWHLEERRLKR